MFWAQDVLQYHLFTMYCFIYKGGITPLPTPLAPLPLYATALMCKYYLLLAECPSRQAGEVKS